MQYVSAHTVPKKHNSCPRRAAIVLFGDNIKARHHLPEVPTTAEVAKAGIAVGEMNALLLKKVEELTLHVIELSKELDKVKSSKN